jgi:hypothetical protein
VSRPDPDRQSTAPRTRPPGLHPSLQRASPPPLFGPAIADRRTTGQGQRPTSISTMFGAETYSAASSTSTRPQRDNRRSGFRHPQVSVSDSVSDLGREQGRSGSLPHRPASSHVAQVLYRHVTSQSID